MISSSPICLDMKRDAGWQHMCAKRFEETPREIANLLVKQLEKRDTSVDAALQALYHAFTALCFAAAEHSCVPDSEVHSVLDKFAELGKADWAKLSAKRIQN